MKKQLVLILASCLLFSAAFLSCKKSPEPSYTPPPPSFISFNLAGTPTYLSGYENSISTGSGGGAYTSSGFFNFTQDINININIDKDSILGSDLQALVGQQLPILSCSGCAQTNVNMNYTPGNGFNANQYMTNPSYNPFPANYFKITSVAFVNTSPNTLGSGNVNNYLLTGVFNAVLSYGTDSMQATNGHFRLLFQEFKGG